MKKNILSIIVALFVYNVYSIEIVIETVLEVTGQKNNAFSELIYFHNVLFFYDPGDLRHFQNGGLVATIPEMTETKITRITELYTTIVDFGKSYNKDRLFYSFFDYAPETYYYGYEIIVSNSGQVEAVTSNKDIIKAAGKEGDFYKSIQKKYYDGFDNWILFTPKHKNEDSVSESGLYYYFKNGNMSYNFNNVCNPLLIHRYAINDKVNKVAILYIGAQNEIADNSKMSNRIIIFKIILNGIVNDTRVRLRTDPNLESETLGFLNRGDVVKIIDRSNEKQKIGLMNNYWYKVEVSGYPVGWVYGAYVTVE